MNENAPYPQPGDSLYIPSGECFYVLLADFTSSLVYLKFHKEGRMPDAFVWTFEQWNSFYGAYKKKNILKR